MFGSLQRGELRVLARDALGNRDGVERVLFEQRAMESVVVPGHGEVCDRSEVRQFRRFIETCISMTRGAIQQGKSKEDAAAAISFEELYPVNRCLRAVHPGGAMQRRNVLRLYEMLAKQKNI